MHARVHVEMHLSARMHSDTHGRTSWKGVWAHSGSKSMGKCPWPMRYLLTHAHMSPRSTSYADSTARCDLQQYRSRCASERACVQVCVRACVHVHAASARTPACPHVRPPAHPPARPHTHMHAHRMCRGSAKATRPSAASATALYAHRQITCMCPFHRTHTRDTRPVVHGPMGPGITGPYGINPCAIRHIVSSWHDLAHGMGHTWHGARYPALPYAAGCAMVSCMPCCMATRHGILVPATRIDVCPPLSRAHSMAHEVTAHSMAHEVMAHSMVAVAHVVMAPQHD